MHIVVMVAAANTYMASFEKVVTGELVDEIEIVVKAEGEGICEGESEDVGVSVGFGEGEVVTEGTSVGVGEGVGEGVGVGKGVGEGVGYGPEKGKFFSVQLRHNIQSALFIRYQAHTL